MLGASHVAGEWVYPDPPTGCAFHTPWERLTGCEQKKGDEREKLISQSEYCFEGGGRCSQTQGLRDLSSFISRGLSCIPLLRF